MLINSNRLTANGDLFLSGQTVGILRKMGFPLPLSPKLIQHSVDRLGKAERRCALLSGESKKIVCASAAATSLVALGCLGLAASLTVCSPPALGVACAAIGIVSVFAGLLSNQLLLNRAYGDESRMRWKRAAFLFAGSIAAYHVWDQLRTARQERNAWKGNVANYRAQLALYFRNHLKECTAVLEKKAADFLSDPARAQLALDEIQNAAAVLGAR